MESLTREFLRVLSGYVSGNGSGYVSGNGSGNGSGYGLGDGTGYGSGYGSGNGSGYGLGDGTDYVSGNGSGNGSGYGLGYVSGNGSGYVSGNGLGDGTGYGSGYGYDITSINGKSVYVIDNTQTIIENVRGNIANGCILNSDFTLSPCYICKGENEFAHGATLHEAFSDLMYKLMLKKPIEGRVSEFKKHFGDFDKEYPNKDLYEWHHILTGSCKIGRDIFAINHKIDIENGSMTVNEFIKLTENEYNGDVIKKLKLRKVKSDKENRYGSC